VLALCEVFWVPSLKSAEIFIESDAFLEEGSHLMALRYFKCAFYSVVVETVSPSALVRQTGEFVVGLL
jgi:hypothetical protein